MRTFRRELLFRTPTPRNHERSRFVAGYVANNGTRQRDIGNALLDDLSSAWKVGFMATKQEMIDSITAGISRVEQTFGSLSDEQLAQQVHDAEGGWSAKQILAHLAGRKSSYDAIVAMAQGSAPPFASGVDDWNQQAVDQRIGKSRDELLDEFRRVHRGLIEQVRGMDDDLLTASIDLPRGSAQVSDVIANSGGRHSINHSAEVEAALGLGTPGD